MTYFPMRTLATDAPATAPRETLFGRMLRLWVEHYQRVVDCGLRDL